MVFPSSSFVFLFLQICTEYIRLWDSSYTVLEIGEIQDVDDSLQGGFHVFHTHTHTHTGGDTFCVYFLLELFFQSYMRMDKLCSLLVLVLVLGLAQVSAFSLSGSHRPSLLGHSAKSSIKMAVAEVTSTTALDKEVEAAGDKLVVIDYSTTWCGPCKIALPKFVDLSEKYENVVFLKCVGDTSTEASQLMKREGVRSVPSFHFWKGGVKVEVVNGARIEDVEAAVTANL